MSLKRKIITNLFIIGVILTVGLLLFHDGILSFISKAANAPVFTANTAAKGVALEIAFCDDADTEKCIDILFEQKVEATLFFCPRVMEEHADAVEKAKTLGFHTGLYDCGKHTDEKGVEASGDILVLSDCAWNTDEDVWGANPQICWSLDANKALEYYDMEALSEKFYDDCVVLYRVQKDIDELDDLIKIIREKGYNITNVKSMMK